MHTHSFPQHIQPMAHVTARPASADFIASCCVTPPQAQDSYVWLPGCWFFPTTHKFYFLATRLFFAFFFFLHLIAQEVNVTGWNISRLLLLLLFSSMISAYNNAKKLILLLWMCIFLEGSEEGYKLQLASKTWHQNSGFFLLEIEWTISPPPRWQQAHGCMQEALPEQQSGFEAIFSKEQGGSLSLQQKSSQGSGCTRAHAYSPSQSRKLSENWGPQKPGMYFWEQA